METEHGRLGTEYNLCGDGEVSCMAMALALRQRQRHLGRRHSTSVFQAAISQFSGFQQSLWVCLCLGRLMMLTSSPGSKSTLCRCIHPATARARGECHYCRFMLVLLLQGADQLGCGWRKHGTVVLAAEYGVPSSGKMTKGQWPWGKPSTNSVGCSLACL